MWKPGMKVITTELGIRSQLFYFYKTCRDLHDYLDPESTEHDGPRRLNNSHKAIILHTVEVQNTHDTGLSALHFGPKGYEYLGP